MDLEIIFNNSVTQPHVFVRNHFLTQHLLLDAELAVVKIDRALRCVTIQETMEASAEWCLIESDPGVFSELVELFGVTGLVFEELLEINDTTLTNLASSKTVFGYIFLSRYTSDNAYPEDKTSFIPEPPYNVLFPKQVTQNACATVAILSLLLNREEIRIGEQLQNLKSFCAGSDPILQGIGILHSDFLREAHNSFKSRAPFEITQGKGAQEQSAFHFISYVPHGGKVYELDGLQEAPVCLGSYHGNEWHQLVQSRLKKRIEKLQSNSQDASEICFNLMAAVEDVHLKILESIEIQRSTIRLIDIKLTSFGENVEWDQEMDSDVSFAEGAPTIEDLPEDIAQLYTKKEEVLLLLSELKEKELLEAEKKEKWKKENAMRRHDFIPFILNAMRLLAKRKQLKSTFYKIQQKQTTEV